MAGIEAIKGAGMTYQGSSLQAPEIKVESQAKQNDTVNIAGSESLAKDTISIDTKSTSGDGEGGNGAQTYQQQMSQNSQIKKAVDDLNKSKIGNSEAIFGIHEATNRLTIKIVDKDTKNVIKEYPAEKTLDMIAKVWEMAGIMVDEKR